MDRQRTGAFRDHSRIPATLPHRGTTTAAIAPSEPKGGGGNAVPVGVPLFLGTLNRSRSPRLLGALEDEPSYREGALPGARRVPERLQPAPAWRHHHHSHQPD